MASEKLVVRGRGLRGETAVDPHDGRQRTHVREAHQVDVLEEDVVVCGIRANRSYQDVARYSRPGGSREAGDDDGVEAGLDPAAVQVYEEVVEGAARHPHEPQVLAQPVNQGKLGKGESCEESYKKQPRTNSPKHRWSCSSLTNGREGIPPARTPETYWA